jgi:tetratricopeptide (TPR) repeat protein
MSVRRLDLSRIAFTAVVLVLVAGRAGAQPAAVWGTVFPTSQSGEAQQHFLEGVTAMHLHMFEDAEEHFRAAQKAAPDFAMAYWGEALNQHRTIWSYHNRENALAVLKRLGPTPAARAAKAPTAREKAYLAAVETLFGEGPQRDRELAYSLAMRDLAERYPDDIEALAWYCLSLMRVTLPGISRQQTDVQMASAALQVLQRNPRHPGANRYLIQSTDDVVHSSLGWFAVNNLRAVNPSAAEALHIPSHVYLHHGRFLEAAEANRRAFESSMAWTKARGWKLEQLNVHNYGHLLQYAHYAYLQAGQLVNAGLLRARVTADYEASGKAPEIRTWFADLHARHLVELARWNDTRALADIARRDRLQSPVLWLAIGIGAVRSNDLALAREAQAILVKSPDGAEGLPAREVGGLLLVAEGNVAAGLKALEAAAAIDSRNLTRIGIPPTPLKPAMELYGEVLLEQGRAEEALKQFEQGLTIFQRRPLLLLGAARANEKLGRAGAAQEYYRQLLEVWAQADADHSLARDARRMATN